MRFSELQGRAVVSLDNAAKLGEVEALLMASLSRHIVGLKVRMGRFSASQLVPVSEVKNIGADRENHR